MSDEPPVCPGCGAVATKAPHGWVTEHEHDCPWMADLLAEPYD